MAHFKPGDTSRAVCDTCKDVVSTTFQCKDIPFDDGTAVACDILAGVCDCCGTVVSIPAQEAPAIRAVSPCDKVPVAS